MEFKVTQEQGRVPVTVIHLNGDLRSDEELTQKAKEAFEAGARDILLDLTDVRFMSSAGLRALHAIFTMLREDKSEEEINKGIAAGTYKSPHFKLLNPNKNVKEVLGLTGYDMFLDIHTNTKEAIASF